MAHSNRQQRVIAEIDDIQFIDKMDKWYISSNYKKEWSTTIPTKLSYFVYWCTKTTISSVDVRSTVFAGSYYDACDEFEEYMIQCEETQDFGEGYPFSVIKKGDEIDIGQYIFGESFEVVFAVNHSLSAEEFVKGFRKRLIFRFSDDKNDVYTEDGKEGRDFFGESIKKEIEQLFLSI